MCSMEIRCRNSLSSCGHTCTHLGFPIAGKMGKKEKTKKNVKVGWVLLSSKSRPRNVHIREK